MTDGGCAASHCCATTAEDPVARARRGALGGPDRDTFRRDAAGDLAAPERPEGGGARERATERNAAPLPSPAGRARRGQGVPRRVLGRPARGTETRSRKRGEGEAW